MEPSIPEITPVTCAYVVWGCNNVEQFNNLDLAIKHGLRFEPAKIYRGKDVIHIQGKAICIQADAVPVREIDRRLGAQPLVFVPRNYPQD